MGERLMCHHYNLSLAVESTCANSRLFAVVTRLHGISTMPLSASTGRIPRYITMTLIQSWSAYRHHFIPSIWIYLAGPVQVNRQTVPWASGRMTGPVTDQAAPQHMTSITLVIDTHQKFLQCISCHAWRPRELALRVLSNQQAPSCWRLQPWLTLPTSVRGRGSEAELSAEHRKWTMREVKLVQ